MILFFIGSCANAGVLAVLLRARRHAGSSVNTLIANQSAADLFACVFGICSFVVMIVHGEKYNGDDIFEATLCVVFGGGALTAVGLTADIIGLIVITLERYFKIVHALAHRKYYRNWMTSVGVALPWIGGTCLILFTGIGTTRIVNGRCTPLGVWPNETTAKVSLYIFGRIHSVCIYTHFVLFVASVRYFRCWYLRCFLSFCVFVIVFVLPYLTKETKLTLAIIVNCTYSWAKENTTSI